jgi:uncharacterized protein (TIGR02246 family)
MEIASRIGVLVLITAAAACAPAAPAVDIAAEEAAVRALSAQWLALDGKRDAAGIARLFADDARLVWAGQEPVVGPREIQEFLAGEFGANPQQKSVWTTDRIMLSAAGDMAVEYGHYANTATGMDGSGSDRGNYVTVYEKSGGTWKVKADASASAMPRMQPPM